MTRVTDPAGRFATYTYDVAGNRTQMVDAVANLAANPALGTTDLVFDSLNRPVSTIYSDGTPTVSYSYDAQGRRSLMVDGSGTTVYGFDAADRVVSVTRGADVFAYAYDAAGNVTSRTYPDGTVVAGTFDDAGQQVTTTEPAGTVSFAYDVAGNPISSTFPNGVTRTTSFDNASRVTTVNNSSGVVVLSRFTYVRDANGNPTGIDYTNATGLVPVESQRLTYDNADRLTKVCQTATTCTAANQTVWSYDKNGNRLTEKVGAAAQSVYTYDTSDQLSAISGPGAKAFSYNANGDQTVAGADTATFNMARQTTGATVNGVATTFGYDGNGNRHTITSAGVATAELWDTMGGLPNLAIERSAAGVVQRRYTYGRGTETLGYNDPAAGTQGWYMTDALGSVGTITNSSGVAVATYTYNPFGTQRLNTTTPGYAANPFKYTGQHLDPTGNYNLRARQYNPSLGRFTQVDPLPYGAGNQFESSYIYGGNMPTVMSDLTGRRFSVAGSGRSESYGEGIFSGENVNSDWAGRQILTWWLTGGGKKRTKANNPEWSRYLQDSTVSHLETGLAEMSTRVLDACGALLSGRSACRRGISTSVVPGFAFDNGEGILGYNYLHGPSKGFRFNSVVRSSTSSGRIFVDLSVTFADEIDPNQQYTTDKSKSAFAKKWCGRISKTVPGTVCKPTDYDIELTWEQRFELTQSNNGALALPVLTYAGIQSGPPPGTPPSS